MGRSSGPRQLLESDHSFNWTKWKMPLIFLRPVENAPWGTGLPRQARTSFLCSRAMAPGLCVVPESTGHTQAWSMLIEKGEAGKCQEEWKARKTTFLLL